MKVSVRKISEVTGFSPATVSNALNRKKGVNKETAEKIFEAAEKLGYHSGEKITKIKFVIFRRNGLIIDESAFHPAVIEGVEKQAKEMGYETVFTYVDINDPESRTQIKGITEDTSAAVVLLGTEMLEEDFKLFADAKCHIILLDGWSDIFFFDAVLISNTDAACRAMEYLVEKGHRRIGYIGGDFRIQAFKYREIGYRRVMEKYRLPVEDGYQVLVGTKIETAYEKMKEYLEHNKELPTAFFSDNDIIAIGAMRALQEKGYRIPEDVSVVGFDDLNFGLVSNPPLTTVHVYKREMGEIAVRELAEAMQNKNKMKCKIQVCTEFIERGSVRDVVQ